ncbi:MAG: HD domain-containing phosphohydrolase [Bacilli bacterium]
MKNIIDDAFIKNGSFGYARYQQINGLLCLKTCNASLMQLFGVEVISFLQNRSDDIHSSLLSVVHQWLNLIHEVREDDKIRILTTYFQERQSYYRFYVFSTERESITSVIIKLPSIHNDSWEKEIIYQKTISNVIDMLWIMNQSLDSLFIASSTKNIFGYSLENIKPDFFKNRLVSKSESIQQQVHSLLTGNGPVFRKFDVIEQNQEGTLASIRYFLTRLTNINNENIGAIGITKNITNRLINKAQLQSSKMMLDSIMTSTAEGIYGVDLCGECIFCNDACLKQLGYSTESELIGRNMHALIHHHNQQGDICHYHDSSIYEVLSTGRRSLRIEAILWRKDGTSFIGECYGYPQYDHGVVIGAIMTFYDITKLKTVMDDLAESERSQAHFLSNLPGMAYRCRFDQQWTMLFVSEGVTDLLGYQSEELLYNRDVAFHDLIDPEFCDIIGKKFNKLLRNRQKFREEYRIRTKDGTLKWVLEMGQGVYDDTAEVIVIEGIIIDITEQKIRQEEAEYLNTYDRLTGLYNRIYFEQLMETYDQVEYFPLTYMTGDINGLKLINDAYGHEFGDQYIQKMVEIIRKQVGHEGIIGRMGGDDFAILLPNTSREDAYGLFKAIQEAVKRYNQLKESYVPDLSISLGFETKGDHLSLFQDIVKNAELYMSRRKLLERSSSHSAILTSIKKTMFERSQETEEHAERMAQLSIRLGALLQLSQSQLDLLNVLAMLHDIGKVGIDDQILKKAGPLTEEEWMQMKKHPEIGYRICLTSPELSSIAEFVLTHHERWDGKGYPRGLKELEIPVLSRILSIVDAYDAMTHDRSYRKAIEKQAALEEIRKNAQTQFDPTIAKAFVEMMEK